MVIDARARCAGLTPDLVKSRLAVVLKQHAGQARTFSFEMLAAESGGSESTLRKYAGAEILPSLDGFLRLAAVLGPDFTDGLLELAGLGACRMLEAAAPDGKHVMHDIMRRGERLASALTKGFLSHQDKLRLAPEIEALGAELISFAAGLRVGSEQ